MQLGVLIENMRREGFELSISPPKVVCKEEDGKTFEPLEEVFVEVDQAHVGSVIEKVFPKFFFHFFPFFSFFFFFFFKEIK